ncbi:hypothetical protein NEOLEDRAFT_1244939 [Neolentinus lepideus HHB14362 ss-1]|uniref:Uncharacterized protein n=1 Tax=Neolentinus lepideus HHB14362 ss-1 TaxID=1314782 RepID=A0A165PD63_9AGAM|nr:hypothetical protein NEOLEDRAFT_1244939 [Neolentinus lepideus HHB14362 ss-1]
MASRDGVLDSSPIPIPPAMPQPNPLKRSASTASLPTPPRTIHKSRRGRGRGRGRVGRAPGGSSAEEEFHDDEAFNPRKKRRTLETIEEAEESDEEAFWIGSSLSKSKTEQKKKLSFPTTSKRPRTRSQSPSKALALDRIRAPVSPPLSRRHAALPITPPRKTRSVTRREEAEVVRDSPENPFLDTPESLAGSTGPRTPSPEPRTLEEKPTITYVFRGKKAEIANPLYNKSPSARKRALLPPEHPDFEPDEACPPKILFPAARRRRKDKDVAAKPARKKPAVKSEWDTTDEEEDADEAPATPKKKARTSSLTLHTPLDQGVSIANGDVDEPLRRALGPSRPRKR